jgi:hypothetical protein
MPEEVQPTINVVTKYGYIKAVDLGRLSQEILSSNIATALDYINLLDQTGVEIYFKSELSMQDRETLDLIISEHVNTPLPTVKDPVSVVLEKQDSSDDSKVPYVYSTSRPMGYITVFSGAGDGGDGFANRGKGSEILFNMKASDVKKHVDISFNEDIYIKDGGLTSVDAPLGAHIDIDVVHPVYGIVLDNFGVKVPVFGTNRWPLDTDDRALIPKGLIVRISCVNATGLGEHDAPADFKLAGRLELFRKKNTLG